MSCWQHSFVLHWMQSQQSSARKKWGDQTKTNTFTINIYSKGAQMWKCVVGWYRINNIQDFQKSSSGRDSCHHKTVILVLHKHFFESLWSRNGTYSVICKFVRWPAKTFIHYLDGMCATISLNKKNCSFQTPAAELLMWKWYN